VKTGIQKTAPRALILVSGFATRHSAASARRRFAGMTKRGYHQDVPYIPSSLFYLRSSFLSILDKSGTRYKVKTQWPMAVGDRSLLRRFITIPSRTVKPSTVGEIQKSTGP